jgi:hypothetical protein
MINKPSTEKIFQSQGNDFFIKSVSVSYSIHETREVDKQKQICNIFLFSGGYLNISMTISQDRESP